MYSLFNLDANSKLVQWEIEIFDRIFTASSFCLG